MPGTAVDRGPGDLAEWKQMLKRIENAKETVNIALVGKYVKLHDAYLSVAEALSHAGYENNAKVGNQVGGFGKTDREGLRPFSG